MATIDDVKKVFYRMWNEGYDGKDLAVAFVTIGAEVIRDENPHDLIELQKIVR